METLRPDLNEGEIEMARGHPNGHSYRDNVRGRSLRSIAVDGHFDLHAYVQCNSCTEKGDIKFHKLPGPEVIDRKFEQQGWSLDPGRCPACKKPKETTAMTTNAASPSPSAVRAQIKTFSLLDEHFDAEAGAYRGDWSDDKIAKEVGFTVALVKQYRVEGFGEIKEPEALRALAADIMSLAQMIDESMATLTTELNGIKAKLVEARKKFSA
jgi:hypothetical protein